MLFSGFNTGSKFLSSQHMKPLNLHYILDDVVVSDDGQMRAGNYIAVALTHQREVHLSTATCAAVRGEQVSGWGENEVQPLRREIARNTPRAADQLAPPNHCAPILVGLVDGHKKIPKLTLLSEYERWFSLTVLPCTFTPRVKQGMIDVQNRHWWCRSSRNS